MAHQRRVHDAHSTRGAVDAAGRLKVRPAPLEGRRLVEKQGEGEHAVVAVHSELRLSVRRHRRVFDDEDVQRKDSGGRTEAEPLASLRLHRREERAVPQPLESWQQMDRDVRRRVRDVPIRLPSTARRSAGLSFGDGVRAGARVEQRHHPHSLHRVAPRRTRPPLAPPPQELTHRMSLHHALHPALRCEALRAPRQVTQQAHAERGRRGGRELRAAHAAQERAARTQRTPDER